MRKVVKMDARLGIPKLLHFIWIGPQQRPALYDNYLEEWRRLHPDWQVKLWGEEELSKLTFQNQKIIGGNGSWLLRADVIRLELMAQLGGVYADCDYQPLRPLDELVKFPAFAVSVRSSGHSPFTNSIFGARPGHFMFEKIVSNVGHNVELYSSSPLWAQAGGGFYSDYEPIQKVRDCGLCLIHANVREWGSCPRCGKWMMSCGGCWRLYL